MGQLEVSLSYKGSSADGNSIDFYDVSQALVGFQRTSALTTHLVLNGTIITQSPSLKNAHIQVFAPEAGSWKITAIIGTVLLSAGVASQDSVLGHLLTSAYDYVLSETMGVHVNFDETLGETISRSTHLDRPRDLDEGEFDAVIEKVEKAVTDIHRPISHSETATTAIIGISKSGRITRPLGPTLDAETYAYLNSEVLGNKKLSYVGKVSSYNTNTYKGRLYVEHEGRPVPMTLSDNIRSKRYVRKIVQSLSANALDRFDPGANIEFDAFEYESKSGRLKRYYVVDID